MTRDPVTVGPDVPLAEALDHMLFGGLRHLPVTESNVVKGMVSMRDLAKNIATGWDRSAEPGPACIGPVRACAGSWTPT
jgi:CBS domain-containing protein